MRISTQLPVGAFFTSIIAIIEVDCARVADSPVLNFYKYIYSGFKGTKKLADCVLPINQLFPKKLYKKTQCGLTRVEKTPNGYTQEVKRASTARCEAPYPKTPPSPSPEQNHPTSSHPLSVLQPIIKLHHQSYHEGLRVR